jgi:hypothetical protein
MTSSDKVLDGSIFGENTSDIAIVIGIIRIGIIVSSHIWPIKK